MHSGLGNLSQLVKNGVIVMSLVDSQSPLRDLFTHPAVGAEGIEVMRGEILYAQDAAAEHLYYIHRGQIRLYQISPTGEERLVEILGAGQWFGCAALTDVGMYVAQAVAASDAQLSKVSAKALMEHVASHPAAAVDLIRQLANTVRSAREEAARLQFQDCNQRLVNAMLRF